MDFARKHWRCGLAVALALVVGGIAGRELRPPQPAVTAQQKVDTAKASDRSQEQHKVAAGTVTVRTKYLPAKCGEQQQLAERIETRSGPVVTDTRKDATEASSSHMEQLLQVTPVELPRLALGGGLRFNDRSPYLRGSVRVFGQWWADGTVMPAPLLHGSLPDFMVGITKQW
jgi:hypothetical protein